MPEYHKLDLQALLELLAKHTSEYTRFLSYGVFNGEEFTQCKHALGEIHRVLKERAAERSTHLNNRMDDLKPQKNF